MMTFAEELILLLLDESTGYFAPVPEWRMSCALAGGVLLDLSLKNRIDSDLETLSLLDAAPLGDDILDPTLLEIASEGEVRHSPQYWVERIAIKHASAVSDLAFERLTKHGILDAHSGGFWSLSSKVSRRGHYPLRDGVATEEIKTRIARILLTDELPDPRDLAIIGLLHSCGGMRVLLEPEELEEAMPRIELFSNMDVIGRGIRSAVQSSYRPPESLRATGRRRELPSIGLIDMIRSPALREGHLSKFFAEQARKHGQIYQIKVPGRKMVVLASAEMNLWTGKRGRTILRTRDYLEALQQEWGASRSVASMDGAEHFRIRKAMRDGVSRSVLLDRLDDFYAFARQTMGDWTDGKTLGGEVESQRLAGRQIAEMMCGIDPSQGLHELRIFEYRALLVHVFGVLPQIFLRTPRMKRYRQKISQLYANIHASHSAAQREGKPRDLADDLLELHHSDPQFLPETDLGFAFVAALIAGHYVGSATAFAIYEMLANPELGALLVAEADALFDGGDPTAEDFTPEAMDVAWRFAMETLRLHPVIPVHRRTAMNSFEVDGMEVPAYSTVLVAYTAPHFFEEHFKAPEKFDIERYLPPREEHKQTGAFQPFGTGTHTCGGRRWTEFQMALNLLLIARHLELEMVPANYRLKNSPLPKMSPAKSFKFRVKRVRHPLP